MSSLLIDWNRSFFQRYVQKIGKDRLLRNGIQKETRRMAGFFYRSVR